MDALSKYQSLLDIFGESVQQYPNQPAFENYGTRLTYLELDTLTKAFSGFLISKLALKPGQRFAIMLPNCLQYPVSLWGAFRAGLTVVNVNPFYTPRELKEQLCDSGSVAIVVMANFADTVEAVFDQTPLQHVIITELGDLLGGLKSYGVNYYIKYVKRLLPKTHLKNVVYFKEVIKQKYLKYYQAISLAHKDIAFLQYTGGTTGCAKGAVLTHSNMLANLFQVEHWFRSQSDDKSKQKIIITALPLYHIFSLLANGLFFMRIGGLNVLITNPKDLKSFIKTLKKTAFTAITGVNTLFRLLLSQVEFKKVDFSHLKIALGGGMPIEASVAHQWQQITGVTLLQAYGLTEASPAVCLNPLGSDYNGSVGIAVVETKLAIRDEQGKDCSLGEKGELCVKGPQVMQGYWQDSQATKNVFTKDGFLKTGDIAMIDQKGFVFLVDRKKDLILVSGFNVYPQEVEKVINQVTGVLESAVIGVTGRLGNEWVKAVVVKQDPNLSIQSIQAACIEHLAPYKRPKKIEFVEQLPKNTMGKILHRVLRGSS